MKTSPPKEENSKKRKKGSDMEASRPTTPELSQDTERPVLQAKRRISLIQSKVSNETPQMREIREKMLQKQAKLGKALKLDTSAKKNTPVDEPKTKLQVSKVSDSKVPNTNVSDSKAMNAEDSNKKEDINLPENKVATRNKAKGRFSEPARPPPQRPGRRQSTAGSESSTKEEATPFASPALSTDQTMTPQMRLLYEKIEQKKALKTGSPRKSLANSAQSPSSSSTTSSSSSSSSSSGFTSGSSTSSGSVSSSKTSNQTSSKKSRSKESIVFREPAQSTVSTRRRSRLSTASSPASAASNLSSLSVLPEEKEPEEIKQTEKKPPSTTSSTRRTRRTIFIEDQEIGNLSFIL